MDSSKTIEKLENDFWPDHDYSANLVRRCHELRKKSIDLFTNEDFRLLITQQIGLKFILDLAIEKLSKDVLTEGDCYPGDLLSSVLHVDKDHWLQYKDKWYLVDQLLRKHERLLQDTAISTKKFYT